MKKLLLVVAIIAAIAAMGLMMQRRLFHSQALKTAEALVRLQERNADGTLVREPAYDEAAADVQSLEDAAALPRQRGQAADSRKLLENMEVHRIYGDQVQNLVNSLQNASSIETITAGRKVLEAQLKQVEANDNSDKQETSALLVEVRGR